MKNDNKLLNSIMITCTYFIGILEYLGSLYPVISMVAIPEINIKFSEFHNRITQKLKKKEVFFWSLIAV